jgi:hypothetical protein
MAGGGRRSVTDPLSSRDRAAGSHDHTVNSTAAKMRDGYWGTVLRSLLFKAIV